MEVPTEPFEHLTEDGLPAGEVKQVADPIMILTSGGTFVVQGREVADPHALAQRDILDYETVAEVPRSAITALLEEPRGADLQRRAQPAL